MKIATPYYLIDEKKLLRNLEIIQRVRTLSGAKSLLALKCFSAWTVFPLMCQYMDGTTGSSVHEVRLGREKFGKETHAYCVAYSPEDIRAVKRYADTVIFNSSLQLTKFHNDVRNLKIGIRVNPGFSYSHFDLADPARKHSRLGIVDKDELWDLLPLISGCMFHFNCENDDFENFSANLDRIGRDYAAVLEKLDWVSLGGGIFFTKDKYPVARFAGKLKEFARRFDLQVYLEPGESAITQAAELITTVIDMVRNEVDIAIVDASIEAHMLDLLTYRLEAKIGGTAKGRHVCTVAGRSCLAGDVFGTFSFKERPAVGDEIRFTDAAGYTMVKKNWFNGLAMPSIAVKRLDGSVEVVRRFSYNQFLKSQS